MLTIYHLGFSQSERIVWLCEELELPYKFERYDRDPVTKQAPAAYKKLHPAGTAPVIGDDGLILSESGAIVNYILGKYGKGRLTVPPEDPAFADYLFWTYYPYGTIQPAGLVTLMFAMPGVIDPNGVGQSMRTRLDIAYDMMEKRLASVPYFAGEKFTVADIMMMYPLSRSRVFVPRDLAPFPHLRAYLKRISERPAYQRAMTKGDPDLPPKLD